MLSSKSKKETLCKKATRRKKYSSLEDLNKLCDIDGNIDFAEELLCRYEESSRATEKQKATWTRLRAGLKEIRAKQNDSKLNLSVVGEFSTGKSTFINALLRQNLLVSSPIQGTTLSGTVIEEGAGYTLKISYLDKKRVVKEEFADMKSLRDRLAEVTTEEKIAKRLKSVHVIIPTKVFCDGIRIIDTPGTNAIEAWHEEVTARTIKENSDMSVILLTADRLVTNTVLEFVKANLQPVLQQCVFVVTHIDHIETENERKAVLGYIKKKIESELNLKNPLILPYASTFVLNRFTGRKKTQPEADVACLVKESINNETELKEYAARMRLIVQAKSLTRLINELYTELSGEIESISKKQHDKVEMLSKMRKADFQHFIETMKKRMRDNLTAALNRVECFAEDVIVEQSKNAKKALLIEIDKQATINLLKEHLEKKARAEFKKEMKKIAETADVFYGKMRWNLKSVLNEFYFAFINEYKERGLLKLDLSMPKVICPVSSTIKDADLTTSVNYVVEELSNENWTMGGAIATGTALGTAILPGVGTAIGALVGAIGGAVIAPNIIEVRKKCKDKLCTEIESAFTQIRNRIRDAVHSYTAAILDSAEAGVDQYRISYEKAINKLLAAEDEKIKKAQKRLMWLQCDLNNVSERNGILATARKKLDALSNR